jgi:hypothetical protein
MKLEGRIFRKCRVGIGKKASAGKSKRRRDRAGAAGVSVCLVTPSRAPQIANDALGGGIGPVKLTNIALKERELDPGVARRLRRQLVPPVPQERLPVATSDERMPTDPAADEPS